jgi:hypothetical protein
MCARGIQQVRDLQVSVPRDYQGRLKRGAAPEIATMKANWVQESFAQPAQNVLEAWNNLNLLVDVEAPGWQRENANAERTICWSPVAQKAAAAGRKCKSFSD